MALDAVGEEFDQGRTQVRAGAVGGPAGGGVDGERVVAVDAKARNAVADGAGGAGGELGAGDTGEGRDRPLAVDAVEDDGRTIDAADGHAIVELATGGGAGAAIADGNAAIARSHYGSHHTNRRRTLTVGLTGDGD